MTLADVRADALREIFPTEKLVGMETALVLFAASFMGRQDAVWVEEAGLVGTCVDNDQEALDAMEGLYPADWEFVHSDAYEFTLATDRQWDVVTVDCPTGYFDRAAAYLATWCAVARHVVILGSEKDAPPAPFGWKLTDTIHRSDYIPGGVWWSVYEKET